MSLGATAIGPVAPLPPGELIGTDLNLSVNNQDPVLHGFLFGATVSNVTVAGPNGTTTNLNGSAAAIWATNASWTFRLPNGEEVQLRGGSVALPDSDYLTVNGMGTMTLSVSFVNSQAALGAGSHVLDQHVLRASRRGSASTGLSVSFV